MPRCLLVPCSVLPLRIRIAAVAQALATSGCHTINSLLSTTKLLTYVQTESIVTDACHPNIMPSTPKTFPSPCLWLSEHSSACQYRIGSMRG
ncbi:hypothetical protein V8C37DRAFT_374213 [Trichoderma ceciliae]